MSGSIDDIFSAISNNVGLELEPANQEALAETEARITDIQEQVLMLHKQKQKGSIDADQFTSQITKYSERIEALEQQQEQLQSIANRCAMAKTWLRDLQNYVGEHGIVDMENGVVIRSLTDEILVFDNYMEIHFKCGVIRKREYVK